VLRVTGVDRVQGLVGHLVVEAHLPEPGAPRSENVKVDALPAMDRVAAPT